MSNSKLTGYPWHIEKAKGYNKKRKSCFNCKYFCSDDNSCNKKNIRVTNNNAPYCNSYNNDYVEEETIIEEPKNTVEELNKTFEDMKENSKTVQERDIITIEDINNKASYKVKIIPNSTGDELAINQICINQKVGFEFNYKNSNFKIVNIWKKAVNINERDAGIRGNRKSKLVIPNPKQEPPKQELSLKNKKLIVENDDVLYFKTQECKKGSPYSEETTKIQTSEKKYKELIKKCMGKELGYRCKYKDKMYKLIYIEKHKKIRNM